MSRKTSKSRAHSGINKIWSVTLIVVVIILFVVGALSYSSLNTGGGQNSSVTSTSSMISSSTSSISSVTTSPSSESVLVIFFENKPNAIATGPNFQDILSQYAVETNYHGISHPSETNYVGAAGGSTFGIRGDYNLSTLQSNIGNAKSLANLLHDKGLSWKEYEENYPRPGACITSDPPSTSPYEVDHDFFIGYKPALQSIGGCGNIQDFVSSNGLWADMSNGTLPNFAFVVPNHFNSGDLNKTAGDIWLGTFLQAMYRSPQWKAGTLSVFITFDENYAGNGLSPWNSNQNQVPLILVSPKANMGAKISVNANHYNLLATIEWYFGLGNLGRSDVGAVPLTGLFRTGNLSA